MWAKTDSGTAGEQSLEVTSELKSTVSSYVDVSSALANDKLEDAKTSARKVSEVARKALAGQGDEIKALLDKVQASARKLAEAAGLEGAREEFHALSENVIAMVKVNPALKGDLEVMRCPMTKGYNKWMQASGGDA